MRPGSTVPSKTRLNAHNFYHRLPMAEWSGFFLGSHLLLSKGVRLLHGSNAEPLSQC